MRYSCACLLISVMASWACGENEPLELADNYTLTAVEGGSLPRLVGATVECDLSISGGYVIFGPGDQFELQLDLITECPPGDSDPTEDSWGYTGSVQVDGRDLTFHTANVGGPLTFEGRVTGTGQLEATVPDLIPVADTEIAVEFAPDP
jgi:hypothetical protein